MSVHQTTCDAALLTGDWVWAGHPTATGQHDPGADFVLNVVQLIKGQFAEAWTSHAMALQEPGDIAEIKIWLEGLVAGHTDHAAAHLIMGLFLSQSGQSEQSMQSYKTASPLAPQSAYPH